MDILISAYGENASLVLENVKTYFSQEFSDKEFTWKRSGPILTTSLDTGENEITKVFEELVGKYPELDVSASYSYDVREDDRSAQWWGTTRIYSEKQDGETKIVSSSSTYWN